MASLTTQRITVSARSYYQEQYSQPEENKYVYAYRIKIENAGDFSVQLLSRVWEIIDAAGERKKVEGEGVVGQQPWIASGAAYEYNSWVEFATPIGAMCGSYTMYRRDEQGVENYFQVAVPKFLHVSAAILN